MRKRRLILVAISLVVIVLVLWRWTMGVNRVKATTDSRRGKAQALVAAYAKHARARDVGLQTLDGDNDRSFGDFGFHYFPEDNILHVRIYMSPARLKESRPEEIANLRKCVAGFNDPKIGGMYDKGGGYFYIDEKQDIEFMAKKYQLRDIDTGDFIKDVDNLRGMAGLWLMVWGPHVADQVFGHEPLPAHFVDREHTLMGHTD